MVWFEIRYNLRSPKKINHICSFIPFMMIAVKISLCVHVGGISI